MVGLQQHVQRQQVELVVVDDQHCSFAAALHSVCQRICDGIVKYALGKHGALWSNLAVRIGFKLYDPLCLAFFFAFQIGRQIDGLLDSEFRHRVGHHVVSLVFLSLIIIFWQDHISVSLGHAW